TQRCVGVSFARKATPLPPFLAKVEEGQNVEKPNFNTATFLPVSPYHRLTVSPSHRPTNDSLA
ncbi:MAG: hypothetical protein ACK4Q5_21030, partial [Saprospiraceae bacterium]